jgi:hypothetical protein
MYTSVVFLKRKEPYMPREMETFYFFRDGTIVCLLHYPYNQYAAKKAMLQTYGKSESDISNTGSQVNGRGYSTFDGRNFH